MTNTSISRGVAQVLVTWATESQEVASKLASWGHEPVILVVSKTSCCFATQTTKLSGPPGVSPLVHERHYNLKNQGAI
jgi:hypothetical protein